MDVVLLVNWYVFIETRFSSFSAILSTYLSIIIIILGWYVVRKWVQFFVTFESCSSCLKSFFLQNYFELKKSFIPVGLKIEAEQHIVVHVCPYEIMWSVL